MKAIHTVLVAALFASASAYAQQTDHSSHHATESAPAATPQSDGEVRKIDMAQGKVTLRHGPLVNLDMPGMTMVFTVLDKKLLEGLKTGDKVKFTADKKDGALVVTAIQAVP